jgi:hypothetical protein
MHAGETIGENHPQNESSKETVSPKNNDESFSEDIDTIGAQLYPAMAVEARRTAFRQAEDAIVASATLMTDDVLDRCERWANVVLDDDNDTDAQGLIENIPNDITQEYLAMRGEQFSTVEIRELVASAQNGSLTQLLCTKLQDEQLHTKEAAQRVATLAENVDTIARDYFASVQVPFSDRPVPVVPVGKYGGLMTMSARSPYMTAFGATGMYCPEAGAITINVVDEKESYDIGLLTHERMHSVSEQQLPVTQGDRVFDAANTPGYQVGFASTLPGFEHESYTNLNEGATELLARAVLRHSAKDETDKGRYEENVESWYILLSFLSEGEYDREHITKELLQRYIAVDGLHALEQEFEQKVGPSGLTLCNCLFNKPQLLERVLQAAQEQNSGGTPETIEMSVDVLAVDSPNLDPAFVQEAYPFISLVTYVRDPETNAFKKVRWEEGM